MSSAGVDLSSEALQSREWDFIVVGTGLGGATLGHALAKAGHSVLLGSPQGLFAKRRLEEQIMNLWARRT